MTEGETVTVKWRKASIRSAKDTAVRIVGYIILFILFAVLAAIFYEIADGALSNITWQILTTSNTFEGTTGGGIYEAIAGTWMLVGTGLLFSVPPGILGSLYVVRAKSSKTLSSLVRLFTDILTSVPSIVIGLFGYLFMVYYLGWGFSLIAGGIALAIMMLPYIFRVAELSMKAIPVEQIHNAYALGADDFQVATRIYIPQALSGVLSGIMLAISIAAGETAQLLYTAGWNAGGLPSGFTNNNLGVGYLTYIVYNGLLQGSAIPNATNLAYIAAFVLIVTILVLVLLSKSMNRIVKKLSQIMRGTR